MESSGGLPASSLEPVIIQAHTYLWGRGIGMCVDKPADEHDLFLEVDEVFLVFLFLPVLSQGGEYCFKEISHIVFTRSNHAGQLGPSLGCGTGNTRIVRLDGGGLAGPATNPDVPNGTR